MVFKVLFLNFYAPLLHYRALCLQKTAPDLLVSRVLKVTIANLPWSINREMRTPIEIRLSQIKLDQITAGASLPLTPVNKHGSHCSQTAAKAGEEASQSLMIVQ